MKGLKTLLKLHKNKIDAIIIIINKLNNDKLNLESQLTALKLAIEQEKVFLAIPSYSVFLTKYLQTATQQKQLYITQLSDIDAELTQEYNNLADEFSELKKVELLIKNKLTILQIMHDKKEEIILNDNILMKYNYDRDQ